jgi:hypothetical protein
VFQLPSTPGRCQDASPAAGRGSPVLRRVPGSAFVHIPLRDGGLACAYRKASARPVSPILETWCGDARTTPPALCPRSPERCGVLHATCSSLQTVPGSSPVFRFIHKNLQQNPYQHFELLFSLHKGLDHPTRLFCRSSGSYFSVLESISTLFTSSYSVL